jgi:nitrogen regulatory protein PII
MTKIEAIVQPFKLESVVNALADIGIDGMIVTDVRGHGRQMGYGTVYRGQEYRADLLHKIIAAVRNAARTGHAGDGKIFVYGISEAIRIRNGQRDEAAL